MNSIVVNEEKRTKAILFIKFMLFSATIAPAVLALFMTIDKEAFIWHNFILAALGLIIGQAGGDYLYYYFTKNHTHVKDAHTKIFAGWKPFFMEILPKKRGALYAGILCLIIDLVIGYYFYLQFGTTILWLAIAGGLVAIFFTPLMLMGFKEIVVFITFGPLSLTGIYFVLSGDIELFPALVSLPVAFLVTIVAYLKGAKLQILNTNDKQYVVKINRSLISVLTILAYLSVLILAFLDVIPYWSVISLVTIFISISVLKVIQNKASEIHDYLWAVVRSIVALLIATILIGVGFII